MVKIIPLGKKGHTSQVDDCDFRLVSEMNWQALSKKMKDRCVIYAVNEMRIGGQRVKTYMHRLIMCPGPGMIIDHINGDTLDNRRENLRICTHAENMRNSVKRKFTERSPYKGVHRYGIKGKWMACIQVDKKTINLGIFTCPIEAAKAYDEAAIIHHGAFSNINFPKDALASSVQEFKELTIDREEFSS